MSVQRDAADLVKRTGVELAATGIGLMAGGPLGALAGAAAAPIVELVLLREKRSVQNMELLIQLVTELSGVSVDQFAAWAQERDGRFLLATSALRAAADAQSHHKVRALAKALADNLHDDTRLDLGNLAVAGLAQVDPPHVQVLHTLVHRVPPGPQQRTDERGWSCKALKDQLPGLADGIVPIVAALSGVGMIIEATNSTNDQLSWVATRFGMICMNYLEDLQ